MRPMLPVRCRAKELHWCDVAFRSNVSTRTIGEPDLRMTAFVRRSSAYCATNRASGIGSGGEVAFRIGPVMRPSLWALPKGDPVSGSWS